MPWKARPCFVAPDSNVLKSPFVAHDAAFFDAGILHGDISVGNILIHNGRGLLIDWDLCFILDVEGKAPRRAQQTVSIFSFIMRCGLILLYTQGTWQFMSVAILQDPEKVHDICDDRESAFYVLTWTALRYGNHDQMHPDRLSRHLERYDYSYPAGKHIKGGELKRLMLCACILSKEVTFNPPLNRLIEDLTAHLHARYVKIEASSQKHLESVTKTITKLEQAPASTETQRNLELCREIRIDNPAYKIPMLLKRLETRNWLVETMRRHLAESDWPLNDSAYLEECHSASNSKKRPLDEGSCMDGAPRSKRRAAYLDGVV